MPPPGFSATASLSQTARNRAGRSSRVPDTPPGVLPAQFDLGSFLMSRGGRWLWEDRPVCPPGHKAVWASGWLTEKCCETEVRVWDHDQMRYVWVTRPICNAQVCGGWEPISSGWMCQPIRLRVVA
jgi:hypothetical protein